MTDCPGVASGKYLSEFKRKMLANDDNRIKDSLTDVSPTDVSSQGVIELPFQSIARAREESKLVRLVLRRYCADQPINTVFKGTWDKTSSTPGEFPGRCYGTVRVCLACFCVYDLIEHARYLSRRGGITASSRAPKAVHTKKKVFAKKDLACHITPALTLEACAVARAETAIS